MTLASPIPAPSRGAPRPGDAASGAGRRSVRGISAATQARLDAGLMRGRLPWPVALYLLCVVVPIWFSFGGLNMSLLRLYLLVLIVPVVVRLLLGHYGRPILTDWLFLAHTLWIGVSLAVTTPHMAVTQLGSVGMEFLGGYAIARAYIRTPEAFLALCRWLVAIVLCLTPFAIYETMASRPLIVEWLNRLPVVHSIDIVPTDRRMGLDRVQSVFHHPIHHGLFCSVVFSMVFVALKGVVSDTRRWLSAGIVGVAGFLGLSSGAWLAILLQVALILWATVFARVRARWWLLVALFALAYVVIDLLSNRRPIDVFMTYATFSPHTAYWRMLIFDWGLDNVLGNAERGIPSSLWVGIGLNDWIRPSFMHTSSMDNFWLVVTVRYGVPGFLTLAIGYLLVLQAVMRRDFSADPVLSQLRLAWVFTIIGLSFTLFTVHVWNSIFSFTIFIFGAGVWLVHISQSPENLKTSRPGDDSEVPNKKLTYSRFPAKVRL